LESPFQLTEDAAPGGGIYRFDLASESLTLLTPDPGRPTGLEIGSAMSSDDQSHIYFTSTADLGGGAVVGANNAYVWTQVDGTRFIATANAGARIDRVTPDGRYALMLSSASVRGAPNNGHVALYEYSYAEDEMDCVSCRPDGSPSKGDASIEAQSAGFPSDITHGRALSFDGRVFFDSADRLVARDENSAMDVYVYDEGKLSLLTTGRENTSSFVAENSDDGQHVFIYTRAALVGADRDAREFDVYDLAVGGGFLEPLPPAAPCQGESCRVGSSARPDAVVLRSSGFSGAGNPMPCAKGKSRRNGHCVKVRRHRRKHAASKNPKRDANRNGKTGR
jgi:hypothetical protein